MLEHRTWIQATGESEPCFTTSQIADLETYVEGVRGV